MEIKRIGFGGKYVDYKMKTISYIEFDLYTFMSFELNNTISDSLILILCQAN